MFEKNVRNREKGTYGGIGTGMAQLLAAAVCSYILGEFVTGNLGAISGKLAVLNVAWIYVLYLLVFAACGRTRAAVPAVSVSLLLFAFAETFVVSFRERPAMFWDVLAVKTAMTVSGNYSFYLSFAMGMSVLGLTALNVLCWFFPVRVTGLRKRLLFGAGSLGAASVFGLVFFGLILPGMGLSVKMWAVNESYREYGCVLATAVSLPYAVKLPPENYSRELVQEICGQLESGEYESFRGVKDELAQKEKEASGAESSSAFAASVQPVNLICIMNESLADIRVAGEFETNEEYFPFISSLRKNTVRGKLCVPVFGAMTSNTEFEFLMGDSMVMLPWGSIAYNYNVRPGTGSLVSTLKAQGYEAVAMHPYPGENWNRKACYENMGFDRFLDEGYYKDSSLLRHYVSDRGDFEKLIQAVEEKENPEDKLFIFNVTMQNHGGYEGTYDNFRQKIRLTGSYEGLYSKADQFLSLMKESDEAFKYLTEYFEGCAEPTMIVMFGDHLPSLEAGFFDGITGKPRYETSPEEHLVWYETPFLIWTNYEQPSQDLGRLSAFYLSSQVLEKAGLDQSPYNSFLLQMSGQLPVVHFAGCIDSQGTFLDWNQVKDRESPYRKLLADYEVLVYNHSIDKEMNGEMFGAMKNVSY